jgi:hypothetical protein
VVERRCPRGRRRVAPTLDLGEHVVGQQRLGITLLALIVTLREAGRLPVGTIEWYLATVHQVPVSVGAIVAARARPTAPPPRSPSPPSSAPGTFKASIPSSPAANSSPRATLSSCCPSGTLVEMKTYWYDSWRSRLELPLASRGEQMHPVSPRPSLFANGSKLSLRHGRIGTRC